MLPPSRTEPGASRPASWARRSCAVQSSFGQPRPCGSAVLPGCSGLSAPPERRTGPGLPGVQVWAVRRAGLCAPRPMSIHNAACAESRPSTQLCISALPMASLSLRFRSEPQWGSARASKPPALPLSRRSSGPDGLVVGIGCAPPGPGHQPSDGSNAAELDRSLPRAIAPCPFAGFSSSAWSTSLSPGWAPGSAQRPCVRAGEAAQVASRLGSKAPRTPSPFQGVRRVISRKAGSAAAVDSTKNDVQPTPSARKPAGPDSSERLSA